MAREQPVHSPSMPSCRGLASILDQLEDAIRIDQGMYRGGLVPLVHWHYEEVEE